jgi:hypothetical protein
MARGIDPTIDIPDPPENVTFQGGNDPSVGLFGFYNRDGYSTRRCLKIGKRSSFHHTKPISKIFPGPED